MFRVSIYYLCNLLEDEWEEYDLEDEWKKNILYTSRESEMNARFSTWDRAPYREVNFNEGLILHEQAVVLVSATFDSSDQEVAAEGWIKICGIQRLQVLSKLNAPEIIIKSCTDLDMNLANISEAPSFLWSIWEFPPGGSLWVYNNRAETWFLHVLDLNTEA